MVPFVANEYYGPLSNFDSQGIGIASLGFNRVFLCNGANGTPDKRGRAAVGAIRSVPGPALDPAVDPSVDPNNPNWGLGDKRGETFHILTPPEGPSHTHPVTDPQHTHDLGTGGVVRTTAGGVGTLSGGGFNPGGVQALLNTGSASTGITIGASGGNQPHNNIQPSIAAYYIMYIP
jgi:hypothetical protein